jgi:hypothetical protein
MKKWDILEFRIGSINTLNFLCTNPDEIQEICDDIIKEGYEYFAYVEKAGKHKLIIDQPRWSATGHHATLGIQPSHTDISFAYRYDDNIHPDDLWVFVLSIISLHGWEPYPGDGSGKRFIKYQEK